MKQVHLIQLIIIIISSYYRCVIFLWIKRRWGAWRWGTVDLPICISGIPNITTAGVACNSTFSMYVLVWLALVENYSEPLKHNPQDHINEFNEFIILISFPWSNTLVLVTEGQVYSLLITHVGMQRCIWNLQLLVNSTFKLVNSTFKFLNVEFTGSCRFQIHLCIPTCVISSEYTWPPVTETSVFDQGNEMRPNVVIGFHFCLCHSSWICRVVSLYCNSMVTGLLSRGF